MVTTKYILPDAISAAHKAAEIVVSAALESINRKGVFSVAFSGGSTPGLMFEELAKVDLPWKQIHVTQVDERVAPYGSKDRSLSELEQRLLSKAPIPKGNIHAMPVEEGNLDKASQKFEKELQKFAGTPPVIDLVHLGLGADGHTASLIPGDKVLQENNKDVAITGEYQGRIRMTLTYPILNRAGTILWLVAGKDKAESLDKLLQRDKSIPAGKISAKNMILVADEAAMR